MTGDFTPRVCFEDILEIASLMFPDMMNDEADTVVVDAVCDDSAVICFADYDVSGLPIV